MNRALLPLLFLFLGCKPARSYEAPADAPPNEPPATAYWMADVFEDHPDVPLGKILLPGAFNSTSYTVNMQNGISPDAPPVVVALWGSGDDETTLQNRERIVGWAKTQDQALGQQLVEGIRFVEINVTIKDGKIVTWHSVYGVEVWQVLNQLVDFALDFPEEVVVVTFGVSLDAADWPLFAEELTTPRRDNVALCDLLYTGTTDAALTSLADIRASGRNLVWMVDGDLETALNDAGCPTSPGTADRTWSITDTTEGVQAALDASVDSRDPNHLLVNDFVFSLDGITSPIDQANTIASYPGVREASEDLGFAGDFPSRLIETYNQNGNLNVLAGAYYEDTTLIEAAIAENTRLWGSP